MNEEPLGDLELICESSASRAFLLSDEGCGPSGGGVARSCAYEPAANMMHKAIRQQRIKVMKFRPGKRVQETINDNSLGMASRHSPRAPVSILVKWVALLSLFL